MASKKKLLTSAIALTTAAALTLGGTFAWQSISQRALNEGSNVVNPGGRLHNDQHWVSALENDNNIYVENFTDPENNGEDIYARVRLSEYMEVVLNAGTKAEKVVTVTGKKMDADGAVVTDKATEQDTYTYEYTVHDFAKDASGENPTNDFFTWKTGKTLDANGDAIADAEKPWFMPTFNKNKDSVAADLNGLYADAVGGISNREEDQYLEVATWGEGDEMTGNAIYDGDSNTDDELKSLDYTDLMEIYDSTKAKALGAVVADAVEKKHIKLVEETHEAAQVGDTRGLISMEAWLELAKTEGYKNEDGTLSDDGKAALSDYWVFDTDGWVYWSAPIAAGDTTGLLLDGFTLNGVMDDTWYYAIDVEAQFVTANDVGSMEDNDGFYHIIETVSVIDEDGEETATPAKPITAEAEQLLKLIGVDMPAADGNESTGGGQEDGEDKDDTSKTLTLTTNKKTEHPYVSLKPGKSVQLLDAEGNHPETATLRGYNPNESLDTKISEETYSYDKETGVLVVNSNDHSADGLEITVDCGDTGCGYIVFNDNGEMDLGEDDTKYISMWADATIAKVNSKVKVNGPFNKSVVYYSESEGHNVSLKSGEDFTYEDGYLTILNSEYAGMRLTLSANVDGPGAEESWAGFLYLTGDSTTDGNPSAGGGTD